MKLKRLARMSLVELAGRGRQEVSKWLERAGMSRLVASRPNRLFRAAPHGSVLNEVRVRHQRGDVPGVGWWLRDDVQGSFLSRFFEGAVTEEIPALYSERFPIIREQVVASADAICRGRFDLLGYRDLFFGDPLDWHLDPTYGRRAPLVHWSRLNPLDTATVGDIKVVWELNRHQWLVALGQAYQLTGDERYADFFAACIWDWMAANPPGQGINWAMSMEVALRLISWCWALALFRRSKKLSPEFLASLLSAIQVHASHIERYLSYYFSPDNHLTCEALGLFYAGELFPELRSAARWRKLGRKILIDQSERQILEDGVYFEQSTSYQRFTVEIYLNFLILAARNGVVLPPTLTERVQRMLDFLLAVRHPNGSMPQIGDADGGWLLRLAPRAADDTRGVFAIGAAIFGRPDYAWAARGVQPEVLWLLGTSGLSTFQALRLAPPVTDPSRLFPEGGYCVMRSGWEDTCHQLIFDAGPLGCPLSGGHGHADLLSVQCSVFGEPYLVDAGTYCYARDPDWRDYFRSTAAHSTVMVNGVGQAVPAGPFKWQVRPRARLRRWLSSAAVDFADGSHDAYCRLPDPVVHRRRVLFVKPRYWVLVDDLHGAARHQVEVRFQFAPLTVCMDPSGWVRALGRQGHGLLIRAFATVPFKTTLQEGQRAPIQGWCSRDYGQRRPAPVLVYSMDQQLPCQIVTLLVPVETPFAHPPAVFPVLINSQQKEQGFAGLVFGQGEELIAIREDDIAVQRR